MEAKILFYIKLAGKYEATGNTRHYAGNVLLPMPAELRIMQYSDDSGFHLLYFDETGKEQTDTFHDTLQQAFYQAEFEFGVKEHDWIKQA